MNALELFIDKLNRLNIYIKQQWGEDSDLFSGKYTIEDYKGYVCKYAVPIFKNGALQRLVKTIQDKNCEPAVIKDDWPMALDYWTTDGYGTTWVPEFLACLPALMIPAYIQHKDQQITKTQLLKILRYIECFAEILQ